MTRVDTRRAPQNGSAYAGDDEEFDREVADGGTIAALNRSEIDIQISTAKKYPRSIARAKQNMIEMATIDEETAKGCGYALKRTGQDNKISWIEGPSIRMAEIAVSCWGNLRYGARVINEDDRFIVAQGVCHDLESNVSSTMEVRRRITTKYGKKYGDDMVGVTANAACAIAARNAVFKVVPRVIINSAYNEAMAVAGGDSKTFDARRKAAIAQFQSLGVSTDEVCSVVDKKGIEDLDTIDLRRLYGLLTAIKDGETTVEKTFRPEKPSEPDPNSPTARLNERVNMRTAAPQQPATPAAEGARAAAPTDTTSHSDHPNDATPQADEQSSPTDDPLALFKKQCEGVLSTSADIDDFERAFAQAVKLAKRDKSGLPVEGDRAKIMEHAKAGTGPFALKK